MESGDIIYYLSDYHWESATIISVAKKSINISVPQRGFHIAHKIRISPEKVATPNEEVCIVWDTTNGRNGRGTYRVERQMYSSFRIPANKIVPNHTGKGRVTEYVGPNGNLLAKEAS